MTSDYPKDWNWTMKVELELKLFAQLVVAHSKAHGMVASETEKLVNRQALKLAEVITGLRS